MFSRAFTFLLMTVALVAFCMRHEMSEKWMNLASFLGVLYILAHAIILACGGLCFVWLVAGEQTADKYKTVVKLKDSDSVLWKWLGRAIVFGWVAAYAADGGAWWIAAVITILLWFISWFLNRMILEAANREIAEMDKRFNNEPVTTS